MPGRKVRDDDWKAVLKYIECQKRRRPDMSTKALRRKAEKWQAEQRGVDPTTIYRNLKFALDIDGNADADIDDEIDSQLKLLNLRRITPASASHRFYSTRPDRIGDRSFNSTRDRQTCR